MLKILPSIYFRVKIFLKKIITLKTIILINKNDMYTAVNHATYIPTPISLIVFIEPAFQVIV
tara:strand:- start:243 stop:428 length:186 start_codon:yes stop_codon:yes gene_type:complete